MANTMRFRGNILLIILMMLFASCGENHALKKETFYFAAENRSWIPDFDIGDTFLMIDNNGISHSFLMISESEEFSKSWGGFLGITTHMSLTEYNYKEFSSNYGQRFSISLTAGWEPYGDELYVSFGANSFAYDFKMQTVSRVNTHAGSKSKLMTDEGYLDEGETIESNVKIHESLIIGAIEWENVLHFTLNDFVDEIDSFEVTEIYISKDDGLVKYVLKSGIYFERH